MRVRVGTQHIYMIDRLILIVTNQLKWIVDDTKKASSFPLIVNQCGFDD
jgi:hypothetical protein